MTAAGPGGLRWRRVLATAASCVPTRADYAGLSTSWRRDMLAGITVGVIALPLALGFGVASGMGAAAGLTTAIVAGVVAAVLGGSRLQVSGPTGAMSVVLVPIVAHVGPSGVVLVAMFAGLLIVAMGLTNLGRAISYVPWPVVEGFTIGIAVTIALQQLPLILGVPKPAGSSVLLVGARTVTAAGGRVTAASLGVFAVTVVVMVGLGRARRQLPASLIAIVVAAVVAHAFGMPVLDIGSIPNHLPVPRVPSVDASHLGELLTAAIAVAALAAIESLLSARVADGMADGPSTNADRELVGQGFANVASAIFGGMPATGAIARTAVNARSGATTRLSAIVHSVVLATVVVAGATAVARIPLAALGGVLVVTAVRMVDRAQVRLVGRAGRGEAAIMLSTALVTVLFNLVTAVEVGIAIAAVMALRGVAATSGVVAEPIPGAAEIDQAEDFDLLRHHIAVYRLDGALFFGAAQRFLDELTAVADVRVVVLRLSQLRLLDATGAAALGEIIDDLQHRHVTVLLKGPRPEHRALLERAGTLAHLSDPAHCFDTLAAVIEHARRHVERVDGA